MSPTVRFGIALTYRCNMRCKDCNRHLDRMDWPDSDLDPNTLVSAAASLERRGWVVDKVRYTGGEPTLHPRLLEVVDLVETHWHPSIMSVVLTNHTTGSTRPDLPPYCRYSRWDRPKAEFHLPWMISPSDLGMEPVNGFERQCRIQHGCGRLFDCYGFSFCVLAGALGRILAQDPYSPQPVLYGTRDFCQHCICSLGFRDLWRIWGLAAEGKIPYPTKTYREGLERHRSMPFRFGRYQDRLELHWEELLR